MIYFTADIHFYHENIINLTKRPFKNADEMNKKIIDNWNNIVKANYLKYQKMSIQYQ